MTVAEMIERASDNIDAFSREMAALMEACERNGQKLAQLGLSTPNMGTWKYLRRYRSKGIALRRRAAGKRA